MGSYADFKSHISDVLLMFKKRGETAVSNAKLELIEVNALGSTRGAIPILRAIEAEGCLFIDKVVPLFSALGMAKRNSKKYQKVLFDAIEEYHHESKKWGRSDSAFRGGRNQLLEDSYNESFSLLEEYLQGKIKITNNSLDREYYRDKVQVLVLIVLMITLMVDLFFKIFGDQK